MDFQTLRLQESPETIPTGEMPRHILMTCERYLTDKVYIRLYRSSSSSTKCISLFRFFLYFQGRTWNSRESDWSLHDIQLHQQGSASILGLLQQFFFFWFCAVSLINLVSRKPAVEPQSLYVHRTFAYWACKLRLRNTLSAMVGMELLINFD
jgi:hypothetical protein